MRCLIAGSLSLLTATACVEGADRRATTPRPAGAAVVGLPPITAEETPERCYASLPRVNGANLDDQIAGRIDLASCVADEALAPLELTDQPESVAVIAEIVGPAFVLLDEAMSRGGAAARVTALHLKGDIYRRMSARMMATAPPARASLVARWVEPWDARARQTHQAVVDLGNEHPELLEEPATRVAIFDSERKLAVPVAARE